MTEHDHRTSLIHELDGLGAFDLHEPPEGFADAVLQRRSADEENGTPKPADGSKSGGQRHRAVPGEPAPRREGRARERGAWVGAVLGFAAAMVLVLGWALLREGSRGPTSGALQADARQTIRIGQRALAVAEPGTALSRRTEGDRADVEQTKGSVFYRVESGAPESFIVSTPAGDVRVTGTCFSVDLVDPQESRVMTPAKKAALIGAATAVAVTVTVYEGSTVLANSEGELALSAGQTAIASADRAPSRIDDADALQTAEPAVPAPTERELAALRETSRRQADEVERLRAELEAVRGDAGAEPTDTPRPRFASWGPPIPEGFDYFDPTPEALQEMAECGIVAWDQPPVWGGETHLDPEYIAALDLSAEEARVLQQTFAEFQADTIAETRRYWIELGGDPDIAAKIDPTELMGMVYGRTDVDQREQARIAMAMERAGLADAPTGELSPTERWLRYDAGLGHAFEDTLADKLGDARATELRAARGGWPGKRNTWADLCSDRE